MSAKTEIYAYARVTDAPTGEQLAVWSRKIDYDMSIATAGIIFREWAHALLEQHGELTSVEIIVPDVKGSWSY